MAQQAERGETVLELHCSAAARELAEKKKQNCEILLKLLGSVYFMVKTESNTLLCTRMLLSYRLLMVTCCLNSISSRHQNLVSICCLKLLIHGWAGNLHLACNQVPASQFWLMSPKTSLLRKSCQSAFVGLLNGHSEEHFLTILHIKATDSATITDNLSFVNQKNLDITKLVGQGYDRAAVFSGHVNGVAKRMRVHSAHAVYIHCTCQASVGFSPGSRFQKLFGTMTNLWKLFHYSPKKAEALKRSSIITEYARAESGKAK